MFNRHLKPEKIVANPRRAGASQLWLITTVVNAIAAITVTAEEA
jgi:hypothetical protein